jgi:thioredoxin-dependent peroxiredoxin
MLSVGGKAPEFCLKTDQGKDASLSGYAGKRVVLYFFPKADTPG